MFPFVLPPFDAEKTATDVSWLNDAPAGARGFIRVQGEHFVDGAGKDIRFWGVNLNFAGVFPPKDEAPKVAARLAKFGFNLVRMHHYDGTAAPNGLWKAAAVGSMRVQIPREFDPEQIDRFDFFVAELLQRGIYIDLNLHVGRKVQDAEGLPYAAGLPDKDKGVNYYNERLIALQRDFTRMLLTHVNPYTQRAYKDEPGIGMIEVSNENSLLGMWLDGSFSRIPRDYTQTLRERWNSWLNLRYNETTLRSTWTEISEPLDPVNQLTPPLPPDFINPNSPDARIAGALQALQRLKLATVSGAVGSIAVDVLSGPTIESQVQPGLTATLRTVGTVAWAFQANREGLDLKEGQPYTLSFWARANTSRRISVNLWQDRPPHRSGGFTAFADLTGDWKKFTYVFRPIGVEPQHSRLSWNLGNQTGSVQLGAIELYAGGEVSTPPEWTLRAGVPLINFQDTSVLAARRDFAQFLGEVEKEYVVRMRDFLKKDLGVRCPIWHSQAQFGGWGGVWREMASDVIDAHAYWKHPELGAGGWSGSGWKVGNASMTTAADNPLSQYGLFRVAGKPFVMTEWNSGQPNDYGGESLLMAAAYAAWQDWAAVVLFDYHSNGPYGRSHFEGFFAIDTHPVKMATAPAAALLYRRPGPNGSRGDVTPARDDVTLTMPSATLWHEIASQPGGPYAQPLQKTWRVAGATRNAAFMGKTYLRFADVMFPSVTRTDLVSRVPKGTEMVSDTREIKWNPAPGTFTLNAAQTKVAIGFLGGRDVTLDEMSITMPPSQTNFASFALSSLDGAPVAESKRLLLTAVGKAENVGMGWNADRTSVGTMWGSGPTQVEGITAHIRILTNAKKARVFALGPTGITQTAVPATLKQGILRFSATANWKTLWYEINLE